jgi:soluble lytic murein transglycosylase-like protein
MVRQLLSTLLLLSVLLLGSTIFPLSKPDATYTPAITRPILIVEADKVERKAVVKKKKVEDTIYKLSRVVAAKYHLSLSEARNIVSTASKVANMYPGFPTVKDVIALAGIESGMNPRANNGIAQGLMGINYSANGIKEPIKARFDPYLNMKHGVAILHRYYTQLGHSKRRAIMAYNSGITAVKNGKENPEYLRLYERELNKYRSI